MIFITILRYARQFRKYENTVEIHQSVQSKAQDYVKDNIQTIQKVPGVKFANKLMSIFVLSKLERCGPQKVASSVL